MHGCAPGDDPLLIRGTQIVTKEIRRNTLAKAMNQRVKYSAKVSDIAHVRYSQHWHYVVMKIRPLTKDQLLSVPCPTCGAAIKEPCQLTSGYRRNEPHRNRKFNSADALQAQLSHLNTMLRAAQLSE
jgi:hypothetical protein